MSTELPTLKKLERKTTEMVLSYNDDTTYVVSYDDLRHACPCAKCSPMRNVDETSKTLRRQVEAHPPEKPQVRTIGKYALAFEWQTGCSSGIFRYERIFDLAQRKDPDRGKPYVHGAW
ncbi:DUF971 domain-containing protein [Candidatus Poseidonia alphae]|nr:DUF971 domain-containing protein [Candidatus Poseidonia alphae]